MKQPETRLPISEIDPRQALYELQSYQEELVLQNEELEQTRNQNEMLIQKYTALYDHAPSGYLTLDRAGKILELNFYALTYLYQDRSVVINTDFKQFISHDKHAIFDEFFHKIFQNVNKSSCEVTLSLYGDTPIYVLLEGIATDDGNNCLVTMVDITALKQTEDALILSRQEFQGYFENGSVGMSVSSPGKGWIELNQRFCQMLGYTKDELIGINWMDLSHPDDLAANLYLYQQAIDGKLDKYQMDKRFIRKDGSILYVTISVVCQRNEDGTIHQFLTSYVDITEREVAEKALRESEENYRTLLELAPDAFFQGDSAGNFIVANDKSIEFTGFSREELLSMNISDLFDQNALIEKPLRYDLLKQGETVIIEREIVRRNGDRIQVEMNSKIMPDGTYQCLMKDITKRKRAEDELKKSEGQLRSLFENMVEGFAFCKMLFKDGQPYDFIYLSVNQSFEMITGLKNVVGKKISELIPGILQTDPEPLEIYGRVILTGKSERFETYVKGLNLWLHISVYSPAKEHFVAIFDNINDRKLAEEALLMSEQKYRKLHESMMDGFVLVDMKGKIRETNESIRQMLGYNAEELNHLTYMDLTPEKWHQHDQYIVSEQILKRGYSDIYEKEYRRKDGSIFPVELHTFLITDDRGGHEGMWAIVRDITERRQVVEALRESEERFRTIAETLPVIISLSRTEDSTTIFANTAYNEAFGLSKKEISGRKGLDLYYDPIDRKKMMDTIREQGFVSNYQLKAKKSDGTPLWLLSSIQSITYEAKPAILGAAIDITEWKQAEELLKQKMDELESFNNLTVARELKMIDLKMEVNELLSKLGKEEKYKIIE